jgi:hypothetical protein
MAVPDIGKPRLMACEHVGLHGGCAVHKNKQTDPKLQACAQFECLWLSSQDHPNPKFKMPRFMRPDLSHVMFGPQDREDDKLLYIHVDPFHPTAWREPEILDYINNIILARGGSVELIIGDRHVRLNPEDRVEAKVAA